jgi:hypothetical protein
MASFLNKSSAKEKENSKSIIKTQESNIDSKNHSEVIPLGNKKLVEENNRKILYKLGVIFKDNCEKSENNRSYRSTRIYLNC